MKGMAERGKAGPGASVCLADVDAMLDSAIAILDAAGFDRAAAYAAMAREALIETAPGQDV